MVVGAFVAGHCVPMHYLGCPMGVAEACNYVVVPALRIRAVLMDNCDPAEATPQSSEEILIG